MAAAASAKDAMEKYKRAVQAAKKHVVPVSLLSIVLHSLHLLKASETRHTNI